MTQTEALKLALEWYDSGNEDRNEYQIMIESILAQPAQKPVMWTGVDFDIKTTPPKRPWVGLTDEQFVEAARLAEAGNYLVAFQKIQQWLREGNK